MELSVRAGETVLASPPHHGWAWSRRDNGEEGGVPERVLAPAR
tara:strand:+ start:1117 stop:1245 length:129 start_codon:yes stop_codon:yes gene_type:complete